MKIKPKFNNVLIKQIEESEKMYGSIIVPDTGKERPLMGKVLATGPGIFTTNGVWVATETQVDEIVIFPAFGGQRITVKGDEFFIYKDTDLLAQYDDI